MTIDNKDLFKKIKIRTLGMNTTTDVRGIYFKDSLKEGTKSLTPNPL